MIQAEVHFTVVFGSEWVRLRSISQPRTLGLGAEMPIEQGWAQCYDPQTHGTQSALSPQLDNGFSFVYLSQSFSRTHEMT